MVVLEVCRESHPYQLTPGLQHIQALDKITLTRLYQQPATCLSILRLLPPLAKHVIMRMLLAGAVEMSVAIAWVFDSKRSALDATLDSLHRFNIVSTESSVLKINPVFQASLKSALVGGANHSSFGLTVESKDKTPVTIDYLDKYAKDAWETVLHYLVGTPSDKKPMAASALLLLRNLILTFRGFDSMPLLPSSSKIQVMALMEYSGLMAPSNTSKELRITNKGFQFLLQDVNEQVWAFLLQYLEMAPKQLGMDPVDVLNFLFQLGSLELGQDYSVTALTDTQKKMLEDLKHLGLVYQRKTKSSRFYPTRLATSLTSGAVTSNESNDSGYIIVETNFKVYAYTSSPLQIAVLSLFLSLKARFANMVIGVLTRDSVREAYNNGISASQICQFLSNHAHSEMKKQLPSTVVDQIRLWEAERNRATARQGMLYSDFSRAKDFEDVLTFARGLGYVLWSSHEKRMLVVTPEGHARVREHLQRNK
ncbi:RNA polymerase II transcription factor B 52 kDa subunit [Entophlyctis sp. JEL0112]|nr:RNA polymerase II transcription factor B 52 kDa subunit [Entophlyctis sp. JEL0112]